ncbi:hypothetical protein ACFPT7_02050 [Acidicapsa dinghuensis]|uniref:Uncharacterized protein n=1 Tax=Acidicapsa dinghuensis TaxID=2218256 RepID=A0ABW1ECE7_9BACT|nr:hypothetical protein [Acidicapsa dinghuensis]
MSYTGPMVHLSTGQKVFCACGRYATLTCDYGAHDSQACDAPICEVCATDAGRGYHFCPTHLHKVLDDSGASEPPHALDDVVAVNPNQRRCSPSMPTAH